MKLIQNNKTQLLLLAISLGFGTTANADFGIRADVENIRDYKDSKHDAQVLLGLEYRGEKFNMDRTGISYDFTDSNKYAVEALLTSKNSGYSAKDNKIFKGMDDRDVSIDVGGRVIVDTGVGPVVVDATRDINGSKGFEAGIKVGGIGPHATHWNGKREIKIAPTASLRYQNKTFANYYYGVKTSEATANRKAYQAKSALTPYLGLEAQANITKHFSINADLGVEKRVNSVRNSPLTTDRKYQSIGRIGLTYWF